MTATPKAAKTAPAKPGPDLAAQWSSARRLHEIYVELARECVIDAPDCAALESSGVAPGPAALQQAQQWLREMDDRIQVHQLRQFLQTSSAVRREWLVDLIRHFMAAQDTAAQDMTAQNMAAQDLAAPDRNPATRDKIDFLLVQYFSQGAPTELDDRRADLAYVARSLEPVLGKVELKAPDWMAGLDRVVELARGCKSLDDLLRAGVLEQGRKAKAQAGDSFFTPIVLVAFARFGYLMRRSFFRLMLADLNHILDGLAELESQGVETIDCRRAQFSQQEPVNRLRMICQSWKVMFQAEYSSGQPLRMLVDLRASVDFALGRGGEPESDELALEATAAAKAKLAKAPPATVKNMPVRVMPEKVMPEKAMPGKTPPAKVAPAKIAPPKPAVAKPSAKFAVADDDTPEFEIAASAPEWNPEDSLPAARKRK